MKPTRRAILLIDSQKLERESWTFRLNQSSPEKFRIFPASSTQEAIKILEVSRVDCVLCNTHLQGEDPVAFLVRAKAVFGTLFWPILYYSKSRDPALAVKAMKLGASEFLIQERHVPTNLHQLVDNAMNFFEAQPQKQSQIGDLKRKLAQAHQENEELQDQLKKKAAELSRMTDKVLAQMEKSSRSEESLFRVL